MENKFPRKQKPSVIIGERKAKEMTKHLVSIEFRYLDAPKTADAAITQTKTITIGVFDDFEQACENGNKAIEVLENKFKLHEFPDGSKAKKQRFSKNGGPFETKVNMISNLAYIKTPFRFFVSITELKYDSVENSIDEVLASIERYRNNK